MPAHAPKLTPYHVVPGSGASKRILLISYHAPPSNAVGAVRWTGMARHFAERGWGFDILALDPSRLTVTNQAMLASLPPGTRLFAIPETTPRFDQVVNHLVRFRQRVRGKLRGDDPAPSPPGRAGARGKLPIARRALNAFHAWRDYVGAGRWARAAAEAGTQLYEPGTHQWVISSGPPHMSHEGGRLLSLRTGLPLVLDFRDAWRFQEWVPEGDTWRRLATRYEARAVRQSALVVANVEPVRMLMQQAYPTARVLTVTNGVDEKPVPQYSPGRRFVIGYPGTIYVGRDPTPLFQAAAMVIRDLDLTPEEFGIEFMGHSGADAEAWIARLRSEHGLDLFVTLNPGGPRDKAHAFMAKCSVLVAFQQGSDLAVPAKVFEYMKFSAWLMVLAGEGSATADLLADTRADVLRPSDPDGIRAVLANRYLAYRRGERPTPLAGEERFSRRFQADRLMDAMEAATPTT